MSPEPAIAPRSLAALAAMLGLLVTTGPIATDMFLPIIPALADDIGASVGDTEFGLTALFAGMAVGHLFYGPLSDRFGHKPIILISLGLYVVAALPMTAATLISAIAVMLVYMFTLRPMEMAGED